MSICTTDNSFDNDIYAHDNYSYSQEMYDRRENISVYISSLARKMASVCIPMGFTVHHTTVLSTPSPVITTINRNCHALWISNALLTPWLPNWSLSNYYVYYVHMYWYSYPCTTNTLIHLRIHLPVCFCFLYRILVPITGY